MTGILKVDQWKDSGDNALMTSDGAGNLSVDVNLGIKNSSPSHTLDISDTTTTAKTLRVGQSGGTGAADATMIISNGGSGNAMLRFDYEGQYTDRARIGVTSSGQSLRFYTAGNNERMRIESNGRIITFNQSTTNGALNLLGEAGSSFKAIVFSHVGGGAEVGSISTGTSSTSYNTSSDYRLKENVVEMTGATERLKQLQPKRFNFITDADTTVDGFLAHEVSSIVPEAVTGEKDAMRTEEYEVTPTELDEEGNIITEAVMGTREVPDYQGIDQSKLVPLLTASLQEAIAKIEELETRIAALENA